MKPARPHSRVPGKRKRQPTQPIVVDGHGVHRFQKNEVIDYIIRHAAELIDTRGVPGVVPGSIDLNKLTVATQHVPRDDWMQFAQLIGYSVSGFGDLSYADKTTVAAADRESARIVSMRRRR